MKTRNLIKILILFLAVLTNTVPVYADEAEQTIILSVSPSVKAVKRESTETASVESSNGKLDRGLLTAYDITTNGNDSDYIFTVTSTILDDGGNAVPAYGNNSILFGHTVNRPTMAAISNARQGGSKNFNVIAYPVSTTIDSPMTSTYTTGFDNGYDCFVINTNDATSTATFRHIVDTLPVGGTYNPAQDEAGQYQATVILTVTPRSGG